MVAGGGNVKHRPGRAVKSLREEGSPRTDSRKPSISKDRNVKAGNSSRCLKIAMLGISACALIYCVVGWALLNAVVEPVAYSNPPPVKLEGPLQVNSILANGERLLSGLAGPESIEVDADGNLYTGLLDGRIIKVHPSATGAVGEGLVEDIFIGPVDGVRSIDGVKTQGRPLGLRLHGNDLYVMDSYYGLYSIDLPTRSIRVMVKPDDVSPPMKFPNDLTVTKDGSTVYFTDTSHKWNLALLSYDLLEGICAGRIFKLDVSKGRVEEIRDGICFANGIQLSSDETTLIVSETSRYRVLFIDIASGKTKREVVLPGMPDNIRPSRRGGYWVALPIARSHLTDFLVEHPLLRKLISGAIPLHAIAELAKTGYGLAVELDKDGNIISSIHDENGKVSRTASQITETKSGHLLAASYKAPFIVKAKRP